MPGHPTRDFRFRHFACTLKYICGWLAFVAVGALMAQFLIGAWWVDPLASLGIVWFVIREGPEA
jgi:hypothetical protein